MTADCSPEAVAARRAMVRASHPLHSKPDRPTATIMPTMEAKALLLEAKECYEARLREIERELAILDDMVVGSEAKYETI